MSEPRDTNPDPEEGGHNPFDGRMDRNARENERLEADLAAAKKAAADQRTFIVKNWRRSVRTTKQRHIRSTRSIEHRIANALADLHAAIYAATDIFARLHIVFKADETTEDDIFRDIPKLSKLEAARELNLTISWAPLRWVMTVIGISLITLHVPLLTTYVLHTSNGDDPFSQGAGPDLMVRAVGIALFGALATYFAVTTAGGGIAQANVTDSTSPRAWAWKVGGTLLILAVAVVLIVFDREAILASDQLQHIFGGGKVSESTATMAAAIFGGSDACALALKAYSTVYAKAAVPAIDARIESDFNAKRARADADHTAAVHQLGIVKFRKEQYERAIEEGLATRKALEEELQTLLSNPPAVDSAEIDDLKKLVAGIQAQQKANQANLDGLRDVRWMRRLP